MLTLAAIAIVSYLLGSIPAGYVVGRMAGIDIRKAGSGNIGATNVTRVLGKRYGYPVFAVDFAKGLAAVVLSILIAKHTQPSWLSPDLFGITAAVSSVIGHSFPVWLRFKGGKGVATSAGALFGLMPLAALVGALIWFVTFKLTRYVSVASITAAVALPIIIFVMTSLNQTHRKGLFYSSLCLAAVVVLRHRSNLSRLAHGTEPRFEPLKIAMSRSTSGGALVIIGLIIAGYFYFLFDTSVPVESHYISGYGTIGGGRVNNLGLMQDRTLGFGAGLAIAIVGAVMIASDKQKKT
jgi:acyl-phosphate glycerol 3-phosphate acyltransferase